MSTTVQVYVDGQPVDVPADANVAAAVARVTARFRLSPRRYPRAPLCGMGVCFECRVTVDGESNVPACITPVRAGMQVTTHG